MTRRRLAGLSCLEESLLLWHGAVASWAFQLGVTAPRLDPPRLRAAFNRAMANHPLTRCSIERDERGFSWIYDTEADIGEIAVIDCPDDASLQRMLVDQLERLVPLNQAPLIRVVIARRPTDDIVFAGMSHVLADGLGTLRLLRSAGREYRGEYDPPPAVDIATAHRALDVDPPTTWASLAKRWGDRIGFATTAVAERSRLAGKGGDGVGSGAAVRATPAAPIMEAARAHGASFGTYSMAALHVAIERWNRAHGAPCERIGTTQAVNFRPDAWWDDVVVNLAATTSVLTDPSDRNDIASALRRTRSQLDANQNRAQARALLAATRASRVVPFDVRREAFAATPPNQFDTCMISNLRTVADPPRFDDGHQPVIHAATAAMPAVGVALGTYTAFDEVRFLVIYRRESFDEAGALEFVDSFIDTLTSA